MSSKSATTIKLSSFILLSVFAQPVDAGPEILSPKEIAPAPTMPTNWYRDNEWNINTWFAYAFPGTENDRSSLAETFFNPPGPGSYDRFLADEHAFGGGVEFKYFFRRYFGAGLEGFALNADGASYTVENFGGTAFKRRYEHLVGGRLATLTFRYPLGRSRFAPYVWAGGGGLFGGRNESAVYLNGILKRIGHDTEARAVGQFGGGLEIRMTPHVGLISDFSWNVVDETENNFGLVRTGVNFAF